MVSAAGMLSCSQPGAAPSPCARFLRFGAGDAFFKGDAGSGVVPDVRLLSFSALATAMAGQKAVVMFNISSPDTRTEDIIQPKSNSRCIICTHPLALSRPGGTHPYQQSPPRVKAGEMQGAPLRIGCCLRPGEAVAREEQSVVGRDGLPLEGRFSAPD